MPQTPRFHPYNLVDGGPQSAQLELQAGEGEIERTSAMRLFRLTATQVDMLAPTRIVPIPGRARARCKFYRLTDIQALVAPPGAPSQSIESTPGAGPSRTTTKRTKQTARKTTGGLPPKSLPLPGPPERNMTTPTVPTPTAATTKKRTKQTARKNTTPAPAPPPNNAVARTTQTAQRHRGMDDMLSAFVLPGFEAFFALEGIAAAAEASVPGPGPPLKPTARKGAGVPMTMKHTKQTAREAQADPVHAVGIDAGASTIPLNSAVPTPVPGPSKSAAPKRTKQTARKTPAQASNSVPLQPPSAIEPAPTPKPLRPRTKQTARKSTGGRAPRRTLG